MPYSSSDHTFAICAYKESPYLEECILSLLNQNIKSNIIISTSTPNTLIMNFAKKYSIPLYINNSGSNIADDFNFCYSQAKTEIITITHQDDVYLPEYLEILLKKINRAKRPLIFFSDYAELRKEKIMHGNLFFIIKHLMLFPLNYRIFQSSNFLRRTMLSLGNPICCPSVAFIKKNIFEPIFEHGFQCNLDWQAWEKISRLEGEFIYEKKILLYHRIHDESETSKSIRKRVRFNEDFEMFCKFWPVAIAKILMQLYSRSEKFNITQ